MHSLTDHLLAGDDHGRLSFHPDCAVCLSARRGGARGTDAVVPLRTQAAVAAGVLVFSGAAPASVVASEPDQAHEGTTAPEDGAANDTAVSPDFDPGGDDTELPFEVPESPTPDSVPVDIPAPVDPTGDETPDPPEAADPPGDEVTTSEPVAESPPPAPTEPPVDAPVAEAPPAAAPLEAPAAAATPTPPASPTTEPAEPSDDGSHTPDSRGDEHEAAPADAEPQATARSSQGASRGSGGSPAPEVVVTETAAAAPVAAESRIATDENGVHVVRSGESLWSIAKDLVGERASAAQIAREVNRLWSLNRDRIATGDPDMLLVGTRLVLR